jgi:nucleotide-binding universal stress UspA family protein
MSTASSVFHTVTFEHRVAGEPADMAAVAYNLQYTKGLVDALVAQNAPGDIDVQTIRVGEHELLRVNQFGCDPHDAGRRVCVIGVGDSAERTENAAASAWFDYHASTLFAETAGPPGIRCPVRWHRLHAMADRTAGGDAKPPIPSISRIAVGVDGYAEGRDAAALAGALARATGADAILVAVLGDPVVIPLAGGSWKELHDQAELTLSLARDELVPGGRSMIVTDVSVARALERVVEREHRDLLVVGSTRDAEEGRVRIGRRSRQLIGDAPCALAIAPRGFERDRAYSLQRIGVGYDGGPESEAALALAGSLAGAAGAELSIGAVVDDRIPTFGLSGARGAQIVAEWEQLVTEDVERLRIEAVEAAKRTGVDVRVEAMQGRPATVLLELSEEVDLLVIGSRRWGAVARLVLGSTGEALVHDASCPLLVVPRTAA